MSGDVKIAESATAELFRLRRIALYVLTICVWGLVGGAIGRLCGHGTATLWERWDLHRHPRHFEAGAGGA
jgi:hypothetical protein